jgi:hypothetical protein
MRLSFVAGLGQRCGTSGRLSGSGIEPNENSSSTGPLCDWRDIGGMKNPVLRRRQLTRSSLPPLKKNGINAFLGMSCNNESRPLTYGNHSVTLIVTEWLLYTLNRAMLCFGR